MVMTIIIKCLLYKCEHYRMLSRTYKFSDMYVNYVSILFLELGMIDEKTSFVHQETSEDTY